MRTTCKCVRHFKLQRNVICAFALFAIGVEPSLFAQAPTKQDLESSCKAIVQGFYQWYLARDAEREKTNNFRTTSDYVIKLRPEIVSSELRRMLKEDSDAQAKADEIVGLDFDPFFNTNGEFGTTARVTMVAILGTRCRATIRGYFRGNPQGKAFAELEPTATSWAFTDFFYDEKFSPKRDLIRTLRLLAEDRAKAAPAHP